MRNPGHCLVEELSGCPNGSSYASRVEGLYITHGIFFVNRHEFSPEDSFLLTFGLRGIYSLPNRDPGNHRLIHPKLY
jgi:hypothetical protein